MRRARRPLTWGARSGGCAAWWIAGGAPAHSLPGVFAGPWRTQPRSLGAEPCAKRAARSRGHKIDSHFDATIGGAREPEANGSVHYSISGIPSWLTPNFTTGTVPPTVTDTFSVNACGLGPGTYPATITFANARGGPGTTTRNATLTVRPGTKNDCKDGGWKNFICTPGPFKNQGQWVSYFANLMPP